jgi:hypothetical protein
VKRAVMLGLLALACGRTELSAAQPQALVDSSGIDFGQTPVLFPVQRSLVVRSAGFSPLHLSGATVSGTAFAGTSAAVDLASGTSASLHLTFTPPASGVFQGTLTFATDDAQQPTVTVALTGTGTQAGSLLVAPAALDFGRVGEGRTVTRALTLASKGPADLFLDSLGFAAGTSKAFGYVGSAATPAVLADGASLSLAVRFSPTPETPLSSGALQIVSADPAQPVLRVPLTAQINRAPLAVASASVPGGRPVQDLLVAPVGALVQLEGSASDDPDRDLPLRFSWILTTRPDGSAAAL